MARLRRRDKKWIEEKFGERANFNLTERILYSHDIASIPGLIKPFIGNTIPDVVVQPQNEEELAELVSWASERKIPVVLVEHDMGLVMDLADRIIVFDFGHQIAEGSPSEISSNPTVISAYIGKETLSIPTRE